MSFRFQRRIKLGKGLGLNLSKNGVSPSYKTKHGSIGSRGYSIRTGIPGLTYRKSFSKSKNTGCVFFLILLISMSLFSILVSCKNEKLVENTESNIEINKKLSEIKQWYEGGILHKSKITDWKKATERNKLATCGDFCANLYKNNPLEEIKLIATNLKICIDEAVKGHNRSDNLLISEVASLCIILLEN